ncbi:hypothetical protein GCM10028825_26280 [Spirosoma agri]|uniref:Uncharacterized protein n=2 Tax=Spirosoma agri TaxID=1987381 RepID=A0A6M0IDP1_9BACT|nr:hypothetical protein [Spirosoma agri]
MGTVMKATIGNVIRLWFGADTPIRHHKIKLNPLLWAACQRVSQDFKAPSGALVKERYRKSDKTSFAKAVLEEMDQTEEPEESLQNAY